MFSFVCYLSRGYNAGLQGSLLDLAGCSHPHSFPSYAVREGLFLEKSTGTCCRWECPDPRKGSKKWSKDVETGGEVRAGEDEYNCPYMVGLLPFVHEKKPSSPREEGGKL